MRLSKDGLTPISKAGMSDYFRDTLKGDFYNIIGTYDHYKKQYNLTLDTGSDSTSDTISFNENVRGWTSFKSFIPESGVSMAGDYYTFKEGRLWKHHITPRNNFYGTAYTSKITAVFNDVYSSVKNFNTLNYDGDSGWYCNSIITDYENGTVSEFIEKEGKHFNYIKGIYPGYIDTSSFTFQGIGTASNIQYNI